MPCTCKGLWDNCSYCESRRGEDIDDYWSRLVAALPEDEREWFGSRLPQPARDRIIALGPRGGAAAKELFETWRGHLRSLR